MALKAWIKDGKLVVDADGKPILCEDCPCDGSLPAACCESASLTSTGTATVSVNGVSLGTFSLTLSVFGPAFWQYDLTPIEYCAENVGISIGATCSGGIWGVQITISRDDINQLCLWEWDNTSQPGAFSASCSPFHFHYEGVDWTDAMLSFLYDTLPDPTCGIPFTTHGSNFLVINIVNP